jgi:integrase/recombinase XerD
VDLCEYTKWQRDCLSHPECAFKMSNDLVPMEQYVALELVTPRFPPERDPLLVYIGGLDEASRPTMITSAKLVAATVSCGRITNPVDFPWHQLTYGVAKKLRSDLREAGFAPRSVNKALTLIRNVMREAWLLGHAPHEEYERLCKVENLSLSDTLPAGRVVEEAELAALLEACPDTEAGLRDALIIALLVGAGLRRKEAVLLARGDYDVEKGVLRTFGKRRKKRESYLVPAFEAPVKRFLAAVSGEDTDPLVPALAPEGLIIRPLRSVSEQTVNSVFKKRIAQAGIKQCTPHDMRRSFITHQLERGVDLLQLARAVGHSNPLTTGLYDRRPAESDRLAIRGEK